MPQTTHVRLVSDGDHGKGDEGEEKVWISGMPFFHNFPFFSVIFGPICSVFSPISPFSFCLFLCSFSVRRHAHVHFQLFSQKSNGISGITQAWRFICQHTLFFCCVCKQMSLILLHAKWGRHGRQCREGQV